LTPHCSMPCQGLWLFCSCGLPFLCWRTQTLHEQCRRPWVMLLQWARRAPLRNFLNLSLRQQTINSEAVSQCAINVCDIIKAAAALQATTTPMTIKDVLWPWHARTRHSACLQAATKTSYTESSRQ
jgi:hypothetical protein